MKYVVIGFVLVFVPGVLVALVWDLRTVSSPDSAVFFVAATQFIAYFEYCSSRTRKTFPKRTD